MESTKVKNKDLQALSQEIQIFAGELVKTEPTGEHDKDGNPIMRLANPGFLPKFHLNNFSVVVTPFFKNLEETRVEMVKKYGTADEKNPDNIQIAEFEKDSEGNNTTVKTEAFLAFEKDFVTLLDTEVEISYSPLPLSVFETLKIDNFYPTLFKFVK